MLTPVHDSYVRGISSFARHSDTIAKVKRGIERVRRRPFGEEDVERLCSTIFFAIP
jgi:hypothetical protein